MKAKIYLTTVRIKGDGEIHAAINFSNSLSYPTYSGGTLCIEKGMLTRVDGQPTCKKCVENTIRRTASTLNPRKVRSSK